MDIYARVVALVGAVTGRLKPVETKIGSTALSTTAQTITAAINELFNGKANKTDVYTKTQTDSALSSKQNTTDLLDASRLTGDIDPARIPTISFFKPLVSTAATLATLSTADQAKITTTGKNGTFNAVTLADGSTYVYSGGTKTDSANYTLLTDVTPDWSVIANKPASVATAFADAVTKTDLGPDTDFVALFNQQMAS